MDIDWSQFPSHVALPSYVDCMMRTHPITSFLSSLLQYMKPFEYRWFNRNQQPSKMCGLIQRRRGGGGDLVKHFCSLLTSDWVKRRSRYKDHFEECTDEGNRRGGMEFLKILYSNVYSPKLCYTNTLPYTSALPVMRGMREVWKEEGKEDEEGRREWERRWREAGDILNEEDMLETSILHLCIPDYKGKVRDGLLVPSECSSDALTVLLNNSSDRDSSDGDHTSHFPVYDITAQPSTVVIIKNLPREYGFRWSSVAPELRTLIESHCPVIWIEQAVVHGRFASWERRDRVVKWYGVVRVRVKSSDDARRLVVRLDGCEFHGRHLTVTQGRSHADAPKGKTSRDASVERKR